MSLERAASVPPAMAEDDRPDRPRTSHPAAGVPGTGGEQPPQRTDAVWGATSYLLSGPVGFGAIGYGVDSLLGTGFCMPVGVVGGIVAAVWYVWFRYGAP